MSIENSNGFIQILGGNQSSGVNFGQKWETFSYNNAKERSERNAAFIQERLHFCDEKGL